MDVWRLYAEINRVNVVVASYLSQIEYPLTGCCDDTHQCNKVGGTHLRVMTFNLQIFDQLESVMECLFKTDDCRRATRINSGTNDMFVLAGKGEVGC